MKNLLKKVSKCRSKKEKKSEANVPVKKVKNKNKKPEMTMEEVLEYENQMNLDLIKERSKKNALAKQDDINNELWLHGQ